MECGRRIRTSHGSEASANQAARDRVTVKTVPAFSWLETAIVPPWAVTMALQMDSPSPLPALAYELFPGNTGDKTKLRDILKLIQQRFGSA